MRALITGLPFMGDMSRHLGRASSIAALLCSALVAACATAPAGGGDVPPGLTAGAHEARLNGVRMWYRVAGTPAGGRPPVVYLAGGPGGNSYSFSVLAGPHLEPKLPLVYFDQRGTGRSERPASGDYALTTLVTDIEALRLQLGAPKLQLIAHSFGAVLALEYAAKHPERISKMVLVGPLWSAPLSCRSNLSRLQARYPERYAERMAGSTGQEDDVCVRSFGVVPVSERDAWNNAQMFPNETVRQRLRQIESDSGLRNTGELSAAVFKAGILTYQFEGFDRVTAPVLVVMGRHDHAAGLEPARRLARELPRGRIVEYENAGHWPFVDEPERFARDVTAFLRGR